MLEQILPDFYRLEIPLPKNPLKAINCYIIKGERNLIVDTCFNLPESQAILEGALKKLALDLKQTDFFVTHMHADHCGLLPALKTLTSKVFASREDAVLINSYFSGAPHWRSMLAYAVKNGLPADEAEKALSQHPGRKYGPADCLDFTLVDDNTPLSVGDYHFTCIATPGHTKGHMCLYEKDRQLLISGDHILGDITPNITLWSDETNPLAEFIHSLQKIAALPVDYVLPGHRRIFTDCQGRIDQLIEHHRHRAAEALTILRQGPLSAFDVAARMTWELRYNSFYEFPPAQKWFATGETLAHLRYLQAQGAVKCTPSDNVLLYSLR